MQPKLTVITGGTADRVQGTFIPTGLTDHSGNEYYKSGGPPPTGDGGGGGMTPFWRLDIPRDVQNLKWGFGGLATLFIGAFGFILNQIDSRFDRADEKVTRVAEQISDVRVEIAGQRGDIKSILEKLDDHQPQGGTGTGQTGPVHQGTQRQP